MDASDGRDARDCMSHMERVIPYWMHSISIVSLLIFNCVWLSKEACLCFDNNLTWLAEGTAAHITTVLEDERTAKYSITEISSSCFSFYPLNEFSAKASGRTKNSIILWFYVHECMSARLYFIWNVKLFIRGFVPFFPYPLIQLLHLHLSHSPSFCD